MAANVKAAGDAQSRGVDHGSWTGYIMTCSFALESATYPSTHDTLRERRESVGLSENYTAV